MRVLSPGESSNKGHGCFDGHSDVGARYLVTPCDLRILIDRPSDTNPTVARRSGLAGWWSGSQSEPVELLLKPAMTNLELSAHSSDRPAPADTGRAGSWPG